MYTRDNLGRQIGLQESGASGLLRETTTSYEDGNRRVVTKTDNVAPGDQARVSVTDYDRLGRVRLTRQLENAASQAVDDDTAGIKVQTRYGYSAPWNYRKVSNPYRAGTSVQATAANGDPYMGWTLSATDQTHGYSISTAVAGAGAPGVPGALTSCALPGSQVSCVAGDQTTLVDEAGVTRVSTVDALGRLTAVTETGIGATTSYGYDVLGDLTGVTQSGISGRSFVYDSLSRLKSATNPESGTTSYGYDLDSNLTSRTDGRGAVTTTTYDALNRVTGKSYLGGGVSAPAVTYSYFGTEDFVSSVSSSASTYNYSNYDALGRPGRGRRRQACRRGRFLRWGGRRAGE